VSWQVLKTAQALVSNVKVYLHIDTRLYLNREAGFMVSRSPARRILSQYLETGHDLFISNPNVLKIYHLFISYDIV
jgi:hypothetical protein